MTRGQRGRELARLEFVAAIAAICFAVFAWIARPGGFGPMFAPRFWGGPLLEELVITAAGVLGVAVGLVWMIRIYRAEPEPDQRAWRYRDRD